MSESQSRYSIVERLTNKKLGFLDENSRLDSEIEEVAQNVEQQREAFVAWEKDVVEDISRMTRTKELEIKEAESQLAFLKNAKQKKVDTIAIKLNEIDAALTRLESISKVAGE